MTGQRFGMWVVESVATSIGLTNLWDGTNFSKNWSCVLVKKPKKPKTRTEPKDKKKETKRYVHVHVHVPVYCLYVYVHFVISA